MSTPVLDHLVFAGPNLAEAVAHVAELTGVEPIPGGSHVGRGTANYLAALGAGAYLEIIGPDPSQGQPAQPRPFGIDGLTAPVLFTWSVRVEGIDTVIAEARERGFDPGAADDMSRETADGELLSWRLTRPGGLDGLAPFLIDWGTTAHPASRDLPLIPLLMVSGVHPDPRAVHAVTAALGLELLVRKDSRPGLVAVLQNRAGKQVALS
ncbi:VOC family protein [Amycolatopsis sp. H20-H5]|uniref:VOC family protein n=1 Tax=Amycolatopsis sp. H20-H5 TaxID=3046309 RepID=UPI002DBEC6A5|nr:VOC family protein [Amycolatopsis sp. H20-H5]MEC3980626.1 VOC family protein [Amycolatopsis sp. H20-H5]